MAEVGCVCPFFQVWGRVDANDEFLSVRDDHGPLLGFGVPEDFWVTKLSTVDGNDRILGVLCKGVAAILGIGDLLSFLFCSIECVNRNNSVFLVWEEAAGIVYIDYSRAGEDPLSLCAWEDCARLIFPVI